MKASEHLLFALLRANILANRYSRYAPKVVQRFWNRLIEVSKDYNLPETEKEAEVWIKTIPQEKQEELAEKINTVCDAFLVYFKREKRKMKI